MIDKDTINQVLGGLMLNPTYLSETDKYNLTVNDFTSLLEKYIFAAIYNLYKDGAKKISPLDISAYFNTHATAKSTFEQSNGIIFLQDIIDYTNQDNFPFYYKRLKKLNAIKDLKRMGIDTEDLYCENLLNPKAKEINDKFEEMEVNDIFNLLKKKLMKVESDYSSGDASQTRSAADGIEDLLKDLKIRPEVGAPIQGEIFNSICRGARKSKFYLRSASSGAGKTRAAVGDACFLSYPVRFNTLTWEWEWCGSNEKTLFIATEQDNSEIQTLILSYLTGFNEEQFLYNNFNQEEEKVVAEAVKIIQHFDNLYVVKLGNPSIEQVKAVIRQNWVVNNIQNVFYDYIFSSPSLLNEFRDLRVREDVVLGMLSTALKDLAVEMNLFIMSSTQTNAKSEDNNKEIKNESMIRGARSIADKCDMGCFISRVSTAEMEILQEVFGNMEVIPNQVTDIYKMRRGKYTNVRIWSYVDNGTCRKQDLFITDGTYRNIDGFKTIDFIFDYEKYGEINQFINSLNQSEQEETLNKVSFEGLL